MLEDTRVNYCSATELADELTLNYNMAFREAHQVVGSLITTAIDKGILADQITSEMVADASEHILGRRVEISQKVLLQVLDPTKCVNTKTQIGSPAPSEVSRMLDECDGVLASDTHICQKIQQRLDDAAAKLDKEATTYVA
jgi:argininosuccinate lyase